MGDKGLDVIDDHSNMPMLVYVSREKRPFHPHNFKAGALNVLVNLSLYLMIHFSVFDEEE